MTRTSSETWTSLQEAATACLTAGEIDTKLASTQRARDAWANGDLVLEPETIAPSRDGNAERSANGARAASSGTASLGAPSLPSRLRLVHPLDVPRRRLGSAAGRIAFVHAVAHIEFNAINLAWDCVARFRDMPRAYYDDWVSIAAEEAKHFGLLRARLQELGSEYGELPAHDGLWEMAEKTAGDVIARMAMVPRVLEARGLDVTPGMIRRLERLGDDATAAILAIILEDEVAHVAAGSRWFRHACRVRGVDPEVTFAELVSSYMKGRIRGPLNREDRTRAGFSEPELAALERLVVAGSEPDAD